MKAHSQFYCNSAKSTKWQEKKQPQHYYIRVTEIQRVNSQPLQTGHDRAVCLTCNNLQYLPLLKAPKLGMFKILQNKIYPPNVMLLKIVDD